MAILVILLVPFISCIKKNLNVDKNNRSNLDSTTVRSNCKAVSAASKILSICMSEGQWTRVPRESLREKKKKFSKTVHCEINWPLRVFQTSYSIHAIMFFIAVYKKK